MTIKTDFHVHTMFSGDTYLRNITPQKVIDYALKTSLDVVAVTDTDMDSFFNTVTKSPRNYLKGIQLLDCNEELAVFERDGKIVYLLRGIEHHDDIQGHIVQVGGEKKITYNPQMSLSDRLKSAFDAGALSIIAHPYFEQGGGVNHKTLVSLAQSADAIEVFNPLSKRKYNERTWRFVQENGLVGLTNSDDHAGRPGRAHTLLDVCLTGNLAKDSELIKNAVRNGHIVGAHQEYVSFLEKLYVFALKDILGGDPKPAFGRIRGALTDLFFPSK